VTFQALAQAANRDPSCNRINRVIGALFYLWLLEHDWHQHDKQLGTVASACSLSVLRMPPQPDATAHRDATYYIDKGFQYS
jgi:hypothetical protein